MESARSSEMLVTTCMATWWCNSEDLNLRIPEEIYMYYDLKLNTNLGSTYWKIHQ
jgi:hypothetical protein